MEVDFDMVLRACGFEIYERRKDAEPVWRRKCERPVLQATALRLAIDAIQEAMYQEDVAHA